MAYNRDDRTREIMGELGLYLASQRDIAEAHAIAERLLGSPIASTTTIGAIQARTGCACFVARSPEGALTASISSIPLSLAAAPLLAAGEFDGIDPPERLAARPGEPVIAWYGWGMAGLTLRGQALVVRAAMRQQQDIYAAVPFYARAATSDGERVMQERMGVRPLPGAGRLVGAPAWTAPRKVA
jgi:hypothetical protein